ncbi:hypothetical protein OIV83_003282 [Microbotryomycetes sp. JL201]|nr:hypothetical protein OIV83_003282 [Microbotryomycetes sp. JL201]
MSMQTPDPSSTSSDMPLSNVRIDPALAGNVEFLNILSRAQQGLDAIIGPMIKQGATEQEVQGVVERAQAFFLAQQQPPLARSDVAQTDTIRDTSQAHASTSSSTLDPATGSSDVSQATDSAPPSESPLPAATKDDAPYPVSFQQLAALIASGAPIPGIKDIPDKLAEGAPSQSQIDVQRVRKPWEQATSTDAVASGRERRDVNAEEGSGQV